MSISFTYIKKLLSKRILATILVSAFIVINVQSARADSLNLNAQSYILIDSKTGQVLYENNSNEKLYPASTTKIMTAILAIENGDLNQMMVASQAAVYDIGKDGMNIGLAAGEEVRLEVLLHALLIKSANETANIIAENISPSRNEFVELMNKKAAELGAANTHFANTCGKDSDKEDISHLTTAADMAKFARHAMTLPKFREIVEITSFKMPASNLHPESFWPPYYTTNKLLLYNKYKSDLFKNIGIKTGYTEKAGNNLVSAATNQDGMELIAVVMGVKNAPADSIFSYSKSLLEYGFKNYSIQQIIPSNEAVKNVPVADTEENATVDLITTQELKGVLPLDKSIWNITRTEYINENVTAPVQKGDILGYVEYTRNGIVLGKVDVIASNTVERRVNILKNAKTTFSNSIFIKVTGKVVIILFTFIFLRLTLRRISRLVKSRRKRLL
ncbi:MAG: peptidase D-alanyl-D-alanine carboxypeptidase 1 [Clostridiales bacterium]|nr:peptidase D-alanyl-D-alanine carboxypeptidase 1 [Clostridiales bacterium]